MKQNQSSGDNSINIQAGSISSGISYRDARDIAIDVYKENIPKFTEIARDVALERAMELTDALLSRIPVECLEALKDPDIQRALILAQQEYACSGEKDLGEVLTGLLVDRFAAPQKGIKRLALNEALKTAPKLSANHFSALSALMLTAQARMSFPNIDAMHERIRAIFLPVCTGLEVSESEIAYLQYTGCIAIQMGNGTIPGWLSDTYPGAFTTGFTRDQIPENLVEIIDPLLMPCPRSPGNLQIAALGKQEAESRAKGLGIQENLAGILSLMNVGLMPGDEIEEEFSAIHPVLREFAALYSSTSLKHCTLTTIGTTLAYTNLRRAVGDKFNADLDTWVN
ncbi:LPO_1073/Vpar_1526 family protein [Streptomyces decoyicus]|uniref:LPO_1073/Vpar_1526 family protein n=1 Tax=Streptomyces decoyicus TaxID=249567 RepID=UPI003863B59A|nr:hypothetical protein OG532_25895 [Streptomyces decoyicus]